MQNICKIAKLCQGLCKNEESKVVAADQCPVSTGNWAILQGVQALIRSFAFTAAILMD